MLQSLVDHINEKKALGEPTNRPIPGVGEGFSTDDEFIVSEFDIYGARYVEDERPDQRRFGL
jgi:hypothetical protein